MDVNDEVTIPANLLIRLVAAAAAWAAIETDVAAREIDDAMLLEAREALHEQAPQAVALQDAQAFAAFGPDSEEGPACPAMEALMHDPGLRPEYKLAMASIYRGLADRDGDKKTGPTRLTGT